MTTLDTDSEDPSRTARHAAGPEPATAPAPEPQPPAGGDPAMIGLPCFIVGSIALGLALVGYVPAAAVGASIPVILAATGLGLVIAAAWSAAVGQSAVAGVFGIFAGFWLSYAALVLGLTHNWFGIAATAVEHTQGLFLISWLAVIVAAHRLHRTVRPHRHRAGARARRYVAGVVNGAARGRSCRPRLRGGRHVSVLRLGVQGDRRPRHPPRPPPARRLNRLKGRRPAPPPRPPQRSTRCRPSLSAASVVTVFPLRVDAVRPRRRWVDSGVGRLGVGGSPPGGGEAFSTPGLIH